MQLFFLILFLANFLTFPDFPINRHFFPIKAQSVLHDKIKIEKEGNADEKEHG